MTIRPHRYFLFVLLCLTLNAHGQSAKDAVKAFSKLDARIETGVSYRDYVAELGDVNFELKSFADTPEAKKRPEILALLMRAMALHVEAKELWAITFGRHGIKTLTTVPGGLGSSLLSEYPDAAKDAGNGGAMISGQIYVEFLLPFIWRDASGNVARARKQLISQ